MNEKELFIFIYWFLCYTVLFTLLIVSFIRSLTKEITEKHHFLMILSFSFIMIGTTIANLLKSQNKFFIIILQFIINSGICLGIYSIPTFAIKTSKFSHTYKFDKLINILKIISISFFLILISVILTKKFIFFFYLIYILYFLTIAFTSTFGIFSLNKEKETKNSFWSNYLTKISILSILFVPLFIVIDLFSGFGIQLISNLTSLGFRTYPIFFVLWSLIYFYDIYKFNESKVLNQINKNKNHNSFLNKETLKKI